MTQSAFIDVLVSTQARIRSYIAGMGVPLVEVDDIAQDVYLEYLRDQGRRPGDVDPLRWLRGIARNLCNHYFRSSGRVSRRLEQLGRALEPVPSSLEHPSDDLRLLATLSGCLEKLPTRAQEVLRLYYDGESSAEEIGKRFGRSAGAVRILMLRLRAALRDCIDATLTREQAR